jgi:hypothetical protein
MTKKQLVAVITVNLNGETDDECTADLAAIEEAVRETGLSAYTHVAINSIEDVDE